MAFAVLVMGGLCFGTIGGTGGYLYHELHGKVHLHKHHHHGHHHHHSRDLFDSAQPVIFHVNNTNLRGRDIDSLQGMKMDMIAADKAVFSADGFSAEGNVTFLGTESQRGLLQGEMAFAVPGLEAPATGRWITVDVARREEQVEDAFGKLHSMLSQKRYEASLDELVKSFVQK